MVEHHQLHVAVDGVPAAPRGVLIDQGYDNFVLEIAVHVACRHVDGGGVGVRRVDIVAIVVGEGLRPEHIQGRSPRARLIEDHHLEVLVAVFEGGDNLVFVAIAVQVAGGYRHEIDRAAAVRGVAAI